MTRDANTAFARAFVDECRRSGVEHAVLAPGSRSTPLALALAGEPQITLHVVLDERAAAFAALGIGRATGRPAMVVTTSGTAAANLHPAVLEAHHAGVPLLACTADRPPELRGVGAPQTIDQIRLFGGAVRWFVDVEPPTDRPGAGHGWRDLAARAVAATMGAPPGPVHLNLPFREPLIPTGDLLVAVADRSGPPPARAVAAVDPTTADEWGAVVAGHANGVVVLGTGTDLDRSVLNRFVTHTRWIVVAEPGAESAGAGLPAVEGILRSGSAPTPDAWIRFGAAPTSPTMVQWLASGTGVVVDPAGRRRDPGGHAHEIVRAGAAEFLDALVARVPARAGSAWSARWHELADRARVAQDAAIDAIEESSEPCLARDLVAGVPAGATLVVGSSMPFRDVAWFAVPRDDVRIVANRGVNGIDGLLATALGVAWADPSTPVVVLCGDLTFLHDGGGLAAIGAAAPNLTIVVVDNDGGGIFSFLPQAALPEHFETVFGTPPVADLIRLAAAHGLAGTSAEQVTDAVAAAIASIAAGGPHLVVLRTDRAINVDHHDVIWQAVAATLRQ